MTREEIKKTYLESNKEYNDTRYIYWLEGQLLDRMNMTDDLRKELVTDILSDPKKIDRAISGAISKNDWNMVFLLERKKMELIQSEDCKLLARS